MWLLLLVLVVYVTAKPYVLLTKSHAVNFHDGVQSHASSDRTSMIRADVDEVKLRELVGKIETDTNASVVYFEDIELHPPSACMLQKYEHQDRIDQTALPLDRQYCPLNFGEGANVYIIDTGVRSSHGEFPDGVPELLHPEKSPCNTHGTGVASLVGGRTLGVAPGASLFSLNVFHRDGCKAFVSDIFEALFEVRAHGRQNVIVSMSLTFNKAGYEAYMDDEFKAIIEEHSGVLVAAAGNVPEYAYACKVYPAASTYTISVGAVDVADERASFTAWGPCVDVYAPGVNVRMASYLGNSLYYRGSGTSMATPIVSGAMAIYKHDEAGAGKPRVLAESARLSDGTRMVNVESSRATSAGYFIKRSVML